MREQGFTRENIFIDCEYVCNKLNFEKKNTADYNNNVKWIEIDKKVFKNLIT
jgi:hypothetical protein